MEWLPHPLHVYPMCLRTFMLWVCVDGLTIMLSHQQKLAHICLLKITPPQQMIPWNTDWGSKTTLEKLPYPISYISNVFENIHVLCMYRWTRHHVVTPTAVGTHFGTLQKSWITPPQQMIPWCTVVEAEALKPHGMASISTTSIYLMCLRPFLL